MRVRGDDIVFKCREVITGTPEQLVEAWVAYLIRTDTRVESRGEAYAGKIGKALVTRGYMVPDDLEGVVLQEESFEGLVRNLVRSSSHAVRLPDTVKHSTQSCAVNRRKERKRAQRECASEYDYALRDSWKKE